MRSVAFTLVAISLVAGFAQAIRASEDEATDTSFQQTIRPLLSDRCFACHGPDAEHREADLRLDENPAGLIQRGILVPGKPSESELWRRIISTDPDERMPPSEDHKPLTAAERQAIRRWIEQGATWERHWAFVPPQRPPLPTESSHADWVRSPIDAFTIARMTGQGLSPSQDADATTLLRRLCLDLTGLPPNIDQLSWLPRDGEMVTDDQYEHWVDQLLASPHFGERMAVAWMDQARYADTNGYSIDGGRNMWLWRDWVIDAYNRNLSFDQFLVQQLAGDLLPNATIDQRVATGFNRNHMITHEGGTIPEENLVNYVADRVKTTGEVFLGLTMGCAQCHDHKFDPVSQRDYYRFFAFFNSLSDRGLDGNSGVNATPKLAATSVFGRDPASIEAMRNELAALEEKLQQPFQGQAEWEASCKTSLRSRGEELKLHPVDVLSVTSPNRGDKWTVREDGTVFVPSSSGRSPSISARFPESLDGAMVTGIRLVFTPDETFPHEGLGHGTDGSLPGSFLLTALLASATEVASDQVDLFRQLPVARVTASAAHPEFPAADVLDHRDTNGWSPHPHNQQSQQLTLELSQPIRPSETPFVTVMLVFGGGRFGGGGRLTAGQYRLYAMTGTNDDTDVPHDIQQILPIAASGRTAAQRERIRSHYATVAPETAAIRYRLQNLRERLTALSQPHEVMVMNVADKPRKTHVLNRGQYDDPLDIVQAGFPLGIVAAGQLRDAQSESADNSSDSASALTRLDLAEWMINPSHPLTSRVAINRLWQLLFGEGLVRTSADFGSQGTPPTHPQLLDYLAVEFVESGWNVKAMMKSIVMSSTYRQSSLVTNDRLQADPTNRLLSRGPRFRLAAELIRDNALAIAGQLRPQIGGPSVKPYQPPNLWKEISHFGSTPATAQAFVQDHGDHLYRRSLYTFWKRTAPPPSMLTFDAPNREICTVKRSRTNTPLQALVLLNDPQFVEASRLLAIRVLRTGGATDGERLRFAFRLATARHPSAKELSILERTLNRERERFRSDGAAARGFLSQGEAPLETVSDENASGLDSMNEVAAWTSVSSLILNLSETVTKG